MNMHSHHAEGRTRAQIALQYWEFYFHAAFFLEDYGPQAEREPDSTEGEAPNE